MSRTAWPKRSDIYSIDEVPTIRSEAFPSQKKGAELWFEVPAEFVSQYGVLRFRAKPGVNVSELLQSLREGSFRQPFVLDDGVTRRLHFDLTSVQSEMTISDPLKLNFAYTRKMMAFLLFHPEPEHVVIVGLGGGSLTRFCAKRLPRTRITTIEIDEDVIALSDFFSPPVWDQRVRLIHADATDYLATAEEQADVILIDGCDRQGTAPAFCEGSFYEKLRSRLRPNGMLILNVVGHDDRDAAVLERIGQAFPGHHIVLNVWEGAFNHLLFAFNDPGHVRDWQAVKIRADFLATEHGLNFPAFARRLQRRCEARGIKK